jgi:excisionase family DNA binding protein
MRNVTIDQAIESDLWDKIRTARYLGISPKTLDRWLYLKRGPRGFKVGSQVRFRPADVQAYLDSCQTVGGGAAA